MNDPFSNPLQAYQLQNRAMMAQIASQLQANMQMSGSNVPLANTTYLGPQPFTSPTMFGQFSNIVGSMFGPEAGAMTQMAGGLVTSPGLRGMFGPISGAVSSMMSSMPIGGGDAGAFMYAQLQGRLGKSIPRALSMPADFSSQAAIDLYNEELAQTREYLKYSNTNFGVPLQRFEQQGEGYNLGVQLANVNALSGEGSRFKGVFDLFTAATGQSIADPELQPLMELARQNTPEAAKKANELLNNNPALKRKAQTILNTATNAANLGNLAMTVSSMIPAGTMGGAEAGAMAGLGDMLMGITGLDRNPMQFTSAATQSLSMMGALGTATFEENGKRVFTLDRIAAGLTSQLESEGGPYSGLRRMGASKSGQLMQELTRSGLLSSSGVDLFGAIKPEDVKRLEDGIARQLEGFSAVVEAGKRMGMQVNEITQSMQSIYGGRFGEELANAAGREFSRLKAGFTGPVDARTEEFLQAEAQRKAGASMMQQVEQAVQIGRFAGQDARGSMAVLQTAAQLAQDMGLGGSAGIAMGTAAMSRVALSRTMGTPMTMDQALALSRDIAAKGMENPSVQAFASLQLARNAGVVSEQEIQSFVNDFRAGRDIDPGAVNQLLASKQGINLAAFTGREAVAAGMSMSMNDINRFYAQNENVSVTGAVKRAFTEQGVDIEKVVADMTTAGGSELMSAFGMTADQIKAMDFTQFAAAFNKLDSQQARVDLLNKLETSGALRPEVKNAMLSNLGERMDRFGLASDKGTMRTARIRQAEEAERARNGGMTSMEITATAITENQRMLNDVFKSDSSMQNVLSQGLKQIRDSKIAEKVKGGMSQQEAETAVDQDGFSFTELLQSASGVTDPGMRKAVQESLANIDSDLAAAKSSGDTARLQILERQKADMTAFNQILETKDPAERAKKIETLRTEVERDIMNKDKVEREKMTEQQKQTDEAQKATLTSAKTMVDLLAVNRLMASSMSSTAESLKSLDTKVSA
jgi:hypothetical protein